MGKKFNAIDILWYIFFYHRSNHGKHQEIV